MNILAIAKRLFPALLPLLVMLGSPACSTTKGGFNFFSVEQDKKLGAQVKAQVEQQYAILPERGHEEVYRYVRHIRDRILESGKVPNRDAFSWELKIIDDLETLNAFVTPGGYIYVFSGLIAFLDSEDQLAGVLGHEIAHAALRHSTRQLSKVYSASFAASLAAGAAGIDPGTVSELATGLLSLSFSRGHETEADKYSVIFLCETPYYAAGAAGFFRKIEGQASTPSFLSTHPDPGNRVEKIEAQAEELGCRGQERNEKDYQRIKALLKP
jgi:predicted Zn-dependent protease